MRRILCLLGTGNTKKQFNSGFTIVELLVVIVVIGILATITIISYTGISQKALEAAVISDLTSISKKIKISQVENSRYPADISGLTDCPTPASGNVCFNLSSNNSITTYQVDNTSATQTFCITISSSNITKNIYSDGTIMDGSCPPVNLAVTTRTSNSISLSWDAVSGATSYTLQRSSTSDFASHVDITTSSTSATSTGLSSGTYYYRVNVTDTNGTSGWSKTVSGSTQTVISYTTVGSFTFTVPAGVTSVKIESWGAQGGNGSGTSCAGGLSGGTGGYGGKAEASYTVAAGNVLNIVVGATGSDGAFDTGHSEYGANGGVGANSSVSRSTTSVIGYGGTGGTSFMVDYEDSCSVDTGVDGDDGAPGGGSASGPGLSGIITTSGVQVNNGKVVITY